RICEKAFGVDHINTADTVMGIGLTYDNQGNYDEAITQYQRALRIKEKAFGVDHINAADTIMNIGLLFKSHGQIKPARSQLVRSYQIFKRNLGEIHPHTQKALSQLESREEGDSQDDEGAQQTTGNQHWKSKLKKFFGHAFG